MRMNAQVNHELMTHEMHVLKKNKRNGSMQTSHLGTQVSDNVSEKYVWLSIKK